MAWLRDGNSQPDTGFTVGDVNYPAGWIKNAPQSERDKLNIVAAPAAPYYDQRFSWGIKSDGTENWKDLTELKKLWSDKQTEIANQTLAPSDWMVIKAQETSGTVASAWTTYRAAVRAATQLVSNPQLSTLLAQDENKARAACLEYECDKADHSYFGLEHETLYNSYKPYVVLNR